MKKLLLFGALAFGLNAFGQVPAYVPTNELVAWYPFNGNANDESINTNNGTVIGAALTTDRFAAVDSAYLFDGVNDNIEVGLTGRKLSYSAWFKSSANATNTILTNSVGDTPTTDYGINIQLITGKVSLAIASENGSWGDNGSLLIQTTSTFNDDSWHHLVATLDTLNSLNCLIYVDGVVIPTLIQGDITTVNLSVLENSQFLIGQETDGDYAFNGKLDDIGVWNRALSECEIQELYNSQLNIDNTVTQIGAQLTADQTGAIYQWLDCDNNYAVINGETNQLYTPTITGNYAVEVNMNGCVDTSACFLVDYTGIEELIQTEKELVKIVDFMGRETEYKPNTPLIFIYSDGTRERVMKLEK